MRTIIDLPPTQLEALETLCKREGISRAEAIRRAVAALVGAESASAAGRAFGLWRGRTGGLEYQEQRRREWDEPR
ncbi:MAG: ribbon-helix-helix protein, CopG family [Acidobacteria bacterium]|nr:ribbon-helix-helix protein, CopG family [Acidobacteriota bacterium]